MFSKPFVSHSEIWPWASLELVSEIRLDNAKFYLFGTWCFLRDLIGPFQWMSTPCTFTFSWFQVLSHEPGRLNSSEVWKVNHNNSRHDYHQRVPRTCWREEHLQVIRPLQLSLAKWIVSSIYLKLKSPRQAKQNYKFKLQKKVETPNCSTSSWKYEWKLKPKSMSISQTICF